ncbi:cobalt-precorrin-6A reductase [Rhizobium sp. Root708]|uniref:cobalt-precorrin-6A reductase n=1 Tax=Rhizobium sp. Root708 TaxID=1736592 RepID=UPI0009E7F098|nr:cobalt-precorrin-6A reductase [Rhizobium sp. Root708]
MDIIRILMLGGTSEASALAEALAGNPRFDVLLSLAGRTVKPSAQPVPVRIGGFGGAQGLATFLQDGCFDLLIDATHPYAVNISSNAAEAVLHSKTRAFGLRREAWKPEAGDNWQAVPDVPHAIAALGPASRRVFLAIGRQEAHNAEAAPQHFYLVRSVDPVDPPLALPFVETILDRGPFEVERELELLTTRRIDAIIAKNSGGSATYAKIEAARRLALPVVMIERASASALPTVSNVSEALAAIDHLFTLR